MAAMAIVWIVACAVFFVALGDCQLWDRDEPRNAGCAAEMLQRNDWVVPMFNDELRYQKPVLLYWLIMSAYQVWGVTEWAARVGSAVLGVGTVSLVYAIAHRIYGVRTAVLSGVILASSIMFVVAARAATPDSPLIFFTTLALASFVFAAFPRRSEGGLERVKSDFGDFEWPWIVMMGVGMGLATLTKGPIGFLMPMAIIGMFLLLVRQSDEDVNTISLAREQQPQWRRLLGRLVDFGRAFAPLHFLRTVAAMKPLVLLAICLLIALPWYLWVGLRTEGDFPRIFFLREHIGRSTTTMENHSGGIGFYPIAILVGFFPWSLFWLPVTVMLWGNMKAIHQQQERVRRLDPGVVLMLCWVGVQVAVFTIVRTKLPSYVTPCYPALAMLTAISLKRWRDVGTESDVTGRAAGLMTAAFWTALLVGIGLTAAMAVAGDRFLETRMLAWVGVPIVLGGAVPLVMRYSKQLGRGSGVAQKTAQLIAFTCGAVVFCIVLFGFGTSRVGALQDNLQLLEPIGRFDADVQVASYGVLESSWVFYARRPIHELATSAENAPRLARPRKPWQPKPCLTVEDFLRANQKTVIITTDQQLPNLQSQLPEGWRVIAQANYFLKNRSLVLVAPKTLVAADSGVAE